MELKDVLGAIGINPDEVKTIDDFKQRFEKSFVRPESITEESEIAKTLIGKKFGHQEKEIRQIAKEFEIELGDDFKEAKKVTDKVKLILSSTKSKYETEIEALKKQQIPNELVTELENKLAKQAAKAKDYEALLNSTKSEFETYQQKIAGQIKADKIKAIKEAELSKIKLKATVTPFEKKGYLSTIDEKYNIDLDEEGNVFVTDKKGARIKNEKVVGTHKTLLDILEQEAIEGNLWETNKDAGKAKPHALNIGNTKTEESPKLRQIASPLGGFKR